MTASPERLSSWSAFR